jgi:signal transduction histidine kinase
MWCLRTEIVMMHVFLANNREELARRCRMKVESRAGKSDSNRQLRHGIPLFLDQLIRTLEIEQTKNPQASRRVSGPAGGSAAMSDIGAASAQHGKALLSLGLTVDQVVHACGDLCQAITDLAVERDAPFEVDEFRTLNRCLDNAISDAVTEFSYQRDILLADACANESNKRMGFFAQELRNHLGTASLAFSAAKAGSLSLNGATGAILERSLHNLDKLIANSLEDVRVADAASQILSAFSLAHYIDEITAPAALSAMAYGCTLCVAAVDQELALSGNRDLLITAAANLLQNAFKFSQPGTEVRLTAYAAGNRILIDVADHCGGLGPGVGESMFQPFSQPGADRTGLGLGLTIARQSVLANGGELLLRDVPGTGCIFTISLPRHKVST